MFEVVGRNRKEGRPSAMATLVAVLVHAALVVFLVFSFRQTILLAGEGDSQDGLSGRTGGGGGGGGGGGEQVSYYEVPPPPPPPPTPVPPDPTELVPPVPPPPPPVVTPPVETPRPAPPAPAPPAPTPGPAAGPGGGQGEGPGDGGGSGSGRGGGRGPGNGRGEGPGDGGTSGTNGGSSRISPPVTDLLLIPPNRPRGMASRDVVLRLTVNERGDVTEVEVLTPTGNRGYDEQLKRTARDWKFNPARDLATNRAVAAKTDVTLTI